jgi:hypothetical protein
MLNAPEYWRQRAEETRRLADQMQDPEVKRTLHDIAASYEQLAVLATTRSLRPGSGTDEES